MTRVRFDTEADEELFEATGSLELRSAGLGKRLLEVVDETLGRLHEHPNLYARVTDVEDAADLDIRQVRLRPYRLLLIYTVLYENLSEVEDEIRVIAIAHSSRLRGYWSNRIRRIK